jgi:hypothetical protein
LYTPRDSCDVYRGPGAGTLFPSCSRCIPGHGPGLRGSDREHSYFVYFTRSAESRPVEGNLASEPLSCPQSPSNRTVVSTSNFRQHCAGGKRSANCTLDRHFPVLHQVCGSRNSARSNWMRAFDGRLSTTTLNWKNLPAPTQPQAEPMHRTDLFPISKG